MASSKIRLSVPQVGRSSTCGAPPNTAVQLSVQLRLGGGFVASRYQVHANALATVSWPAMNIAIISSCELPVGHPSAGSPVDAAPPHQHARGGQRDPPGS